MSADEDTELRDLIVQTLENNGVISKIKAELRASVFLALEEEGSFSEKIPLINKKLREFVSSDVGVKTVSLVREFLEFFNLHFTLAVFDPEVNCTSKCLSRDELRKECKLDSVKPGFPLISSLVNERKDPSYVSTRTDSGFVQPLSKQQSESSHEDVKVDSIDSSFTSNHLIESPVEDLSTNDTSYDAFFDGPLPTNPDLGIFNTYSSTNIKANQKEAKDEPPPTDLSSNNSDNDQNSLLSYLNNKGKESKMEKKEENVFNIETKSQDIEPSLFTAKTDSLTTLRDFPPLNTRSGFDSDWLFNKSSQKKTLPSLKLNEERKVMNTLEDDSLSVSEHSSKSGVKSAEQSKVKSDVSDTNEISEQSIEEEIEEELSGVDELLSSISIGEESTSDQTVSSVAGYDYVEKCNLKK